MVKKIALTILGLILLVVIGLVSLTFIINPNQFKPLIVEKIKENTGLDLVIEGDISWSLFPYIGLEIGRTELKNPAGFSQPNLFKLDEVAVSIGLLPLLEHTLEAKEIKLVGAQFAIETRQDGVSNLEAIKQSISDASKGAVKNVSVDQTSNQVVSEPSVVTTSETKLDKSPTPWKIQIAGVSIKEAQFDVNNLQTGERFSLNQVNLDLDSLVTEQWTTASFSLTGLANQGQFSLEGKTDLFVSESVEKMQLKATSLSATYRDDTNQLTSAQVTLDAFVFDKLGTLSYSASGIASGTDFDISGTFDLQMSKAFDELNIEQWRSEATLSGSALPRSPLVLSLDSDLTIDLTKKNIALVLRTLALDQLVLDGKGSITLAEVPMVDLYLHSKKLDIDALLPQHSSQVSDTQSPEKPLTDSSEKPIDHFASSAPDLAILKQIDLKAALNIEWFKVANVEFSHIKTELLIKDGMATLTQLAADFYQGKISANGVLDGVHTPATYQISSKISDIQIQPLLVDATGKGILEGAASADMNLAGDGLTQDELKQNINGRLSVSLKDGAVDGINIAKLIRDNYAKYKGQATDEVTETQKTDFSALNASFTINKGQITTNDLALKSPLLRILGSGKANYLDQTIDATIKTSIVGSLKGQGGQSIDELKNITIPINVSGPWTSLKYKLVFDEILKQKAQKEIDRGLEKLSEKLDGKIKDEKTKEAVNNLLKGLFN